MMRALINKEDNSVAIVETHEVIIPKAMSDQTNVFLVEFDEACLANIPQEEYLNLFWSSESNTLYLHPEKFSLSTPSGKAKIKELISHISLVPPDNRTESQNHLVAVAYSFLPRNEVDEILNDEDLQDEEIAAILGALDGS